LIFFVELPFPFDRRALSGDINDPLYVFPDLDLYLMPIIGDIAGRLVYFSLFLFPASFSSSRSGAAQTSY